MNRAQERQCALEVYNAWQSKEPQDIKDQIINEIKSRCLNRAEWDAIIAMAEANLSLAALEEAIILIHGHTQQGTFYAGALPTLFEITRVVLDGFVENQPIAIKMLAELYRLLEG
jgi:hypothetical protein